MRGPGVTETALLADIGGTGARFTLARDGALGPFVSAIPTWLIRHPQPGLLGLAQLLAARDR